MRDDDAPVGHIGLKSQLDYTTKRLLLHYQNRSPAAATRRSVDVNLNIPPRRPGALRRFLSVHACEVLGMIISEADANRFYHPAQICTCRVVPRRQRSEYSVHCNSPFVGPVQDFRVSSSSVAVGLDEIAHFGIA